MCSLLHSKLLPWLLDPPGSALFVPGLSPPAALAPTSFQIESLGAICIILNHILYIEYIFYKYRYYITSLNPGRGLRI
jgi:hypothetical protein